MQFGVSNQTLLDETCGQMTYSNVQCYLVLVETNLVFRFLGFLYIAGENLVNYDDTTIYHKPFGFPLRLAFLQLARAFSHEMLCYMNITRNLCLKLSLLSDLRCTS